MKGLLFRISAESLNLDLVHIEVTGCWYRQTLMRVFVFWNTKASFKGIYTLNGVHM